MLERCSNYLRTQWFVCIGHKTPGRDVSIPATHTHTPLLHRWQDSPPPQSLSVQTPTNGNEVFRDHLTPVTNADFVFAQENEACEKLIESLSCYRPTTIKMKPLVTIWRPGLVNVRKESSVKNLEPFTGHGLEIIKMMPLAPSRYHLES